MKNPPSPSPYADVNSMLQEFVEEIQSILRKRSVGLYLYGSLAIGDFDPETSDIDFLVLTRDEIPDDEFDALREMHTRFNKSGSTWRNRIEAAYIPLKALKEPTSPSVLYPQIERGTDLIRSPLEIGWAFQRHTLWEYGVTVSGPSIRSLIDPVEREEMRRSAAAIIGGWQEQSRHDPSWVEWAHQRGSQAFLVLTLCRIRYSLETGHVASKPAAARWVEAACGPRWSPLIERALVSPHDEQEMPEADYKEMLVFLDETALVLQ
jgi:predicted nucleotidyltransferase